MQTQRNSELKQTLLPETEAFARMLNQLIIDDKKQSIYDFPKLIQSSLSCNIVFFNQDNNNPITTTLLSYLLGYNSERKIFHKAVRLLLQHPDLFFQTLCQLDLYTLPMIYGEVELIKTMQAYGLPCNDKNFEMLFEVINTPGYIFEKVKVLAGLQQALANSSEFNQNTTWTHILKLALKTKDNDYINLISNELKITLIKKIILKPTKEKFLEEVKQIINMDDLLQKEFIADFEPWFKQSLDTTQSVHELPDGKTKLILLQAHYQQLNQKIKEVTPLQHAVITQDREVLQTLLLFNGVKEQEIKEQGAIKAAIAQGDFNLVYMLISQINYINLSELISYALSFKHHGVIRVFASLENAYRHICVPHIATALIKANEQKDHPLAAVLLRTLYNFTDQLVKRYKQAVDDSILKEHPNAWKKLYAEYLKKYLLDSRSIPDSQLDVLTHWGLHYALAETYPRIEGGSNLPVLSREELQGLSFHYLIQGSLHNAINVLILIANRFGRKTYEEALFSAFIYLMLPHLDQQADNSSTFLELTYHINALFNFIESFSDDIFVIYSQYKNLYLSILEILKQNDITDIKGNLTTSFLRLWAGMLRQSTNNVSTHWVKLVCFQTGEALLNKIQQSTEDDLILKAYCLLGSAQAMSSSGNADYKEVTQAFQHAEMLFEGLIKASSNIIEIIEQYAVSINSHCTYLMTTEPPRNQEAFFIYELGIKVLKEKTIALELKKENKHHANKSLGNLMLAYSNNLTPDKNPLAKTMGEEGLKLIQHAAITGTESDILYLARHHFNLAELYHGAKEELEIAIKHIKTALKLFLMVRPIAENRSQEEKMTIYLYRSALAYRLYISTEQSKGMSNLLEAFHLLGQIQKDNNGKLNKEEMVVSLRILAKCLMYEPLCPARFTMLEKFANAFYEQLKKQETDLIEYALAYLHLGHNLHIRGQFEKANEYFIVAVHNNPALKFIAVPELAVNLTKENKLALLYLADTYSHLAATSDLIKAEQYLLQASTCHKLVGNNVIIEDQKNIESKNANLLSDIQQKMQLQQQTKFIFFKPQKPKRKKHPFPGLSNSQLFRLNRWLVLQQQRNTNTQNPKKNR